jgi:voltage-gated potassium channel
MKAFLEKYRYEFLLIALLQLLFNKIFFPSESIYIGFVWPLNMMMISIANYFIFKEKSRSKKNIRNILAFISIIMPFLFIIFNKYSDFLYFLTIFYILYYGFMFYEVLFQIVYTHEVKLNIVFSSLCGYLLLTLVALFCFILVDLLIPNSFHGITEIGLAKKYNEFSYFSFITLTSIGFGDIYPQHDSSRLLVAFFGMMGQFYMVAVVGIIISKFTNNLK